MVEILMATYNGEKYISQQIESILNQTIQDFKILIRDDGSKDNTVNIIKDYVSKYSDKIVLIEDDIKCGSSMKNFMELTKHALADYVMYCDQDDYWLPNKIEVSLEEMKKNEENTSVPILIYTDFIKVDVNLNEMKNDVKKSQIYVKKSLDLPHLLVQNYVTGCCMMVNKALYKNLQDYSEDILMHDWWIAIYAATFGKIIHKEEKCMYYRQHANQVVGATNVKSFKYVFEKFISGSSKDSMNFYIKQAKYFYGLYGKNMSDKAKEIFQIFLTLPQKNKFLRIYFLIKYKFLKSTFLRIIGQLWYI